MAHPLFNPANAVTFNLARGSISLDDAPGRVLVPANAVVALALAAGSEAAVPFAQALGEPIGLRVAHRLSAGKAESTEGTYTAPVEVVVEQLGGELAIAGLGALGLERWGRALVLVVDNSPLEAAGDLLLATLLAAALYRVTGREVYCWPLAREATRVRIFVGSKTAVARARTSLDQGASWGEVLAALHTPSDQERGTA